MTTPDPLDPDVEKLADLFMDLRLDGPTAEGWTYQQTARHYASIILGQWLAGIRQDPKDPLALHGCTACGGEYRHTLADGCETCRAALATPSSAPDVEGLE